MQSWNAITVFHSWGRVYGSHFLSSPTSPDMLHNHSDKLTAEWIGNEATGDRIGLFEKSGSANWNWIENIPTEAKLWKSVLMKFLKTDEKCQEHE